MLPFLEDMSLTRALGFSAAFVSVKCVEILHKMAAPGVRFSFPIFMLRKRKQWPRTFGTSSNNAYVYASMHSKKLEKSTLPSALASMGNSNFDKVFLIC